MNFKNGFLCSVFVLSAVVFSAALRAQTLPLEPAHETGASITGAFEGWFKNADGTFSLLLGYFNRNTKQEVDLAVGPDNRIEPGGPDQGQPTHFLTGRQWGMFTVKVPADFGTKNLTGLFPPNGRTRLIPTNCLPDDESYRWPEPAPVNTRPTLRFANDAPPPQVPLATQFPRP